MRLAWSPPPGLFPPSGARWGLPRGQRPARPQEKEQAAALGCAAPAGRMAGLLGLSGRGRSAGRGGRPTPAPGESGAAGTSVKLGVCISR